MTRRRRTKQRRTWASVLRLETRGNRRAPRPKGAAMIRTVSLAAATSLAALTVTVAPAFGDAWGADQREERQVGAMLDARERALSTPRSSEDGKASPAPAVRMPVVDDRFRLGSAAVPVTGAASPSAAIEWAQVAAGLAAGVLLALGLAYASRRALGRPVAH